MPVKPHPTLSTKALPKRGPDTKQQERANPRVVLFIEENGGAWHAGELTRTLQALGAHVTTTNLKRCAFDTRTKAGLTIPGFDDGDLPDGAFVRSISTGTLEQITFRLGILHALSHSSVRVWNEARVIERCVDKATATYLFQRAGLPVPETHTCERPDLAHGYQTHAAPVVSKPLFGSQGNGVKKLAHHADLPDPEPLGHVYYLQRFINPATTEDTASRFADWRVIVSGGRALAAMRRSANKWITNVHQGATPEPVTLTAEMQELAVGAAKAVGADYAGVDLIAGPDGRLMVLEINSNPAWKGLQSVTGIDIGSELASDFFRAVQAHLKNRASNQ